TVQARYLHGAGVDSLMARETPGATPFTVAWTLQDRLGSVREVADANGVIQATVTYDGFGTATLGGSAPGFVGRCQWTGREFDADTGLQYGQQHHQYDGPQRAPEGCRPRAVGPTAQGVSRYQAGELRANSTLRVGTGRLQYRGIQAHRLRRQWVH